MLLSEAKRQLLIFAALSRPLPSVKALGLAYRYLNGLIWNLEMLQRGSAGWGSPRVFPARLRGTIETRVFVWPGVTFLLFLLVAVQVQWSLLAEGGQIPEGRHGDSLGKQYHKGGIGDERWHYERTRGTSFSLIFKWFGSPFLHRHF